MGSDQGCEFRLYVRADHADHVDNPLELTGVADELASECGFFDGCVRRGLRSQRFQISLKLKCVSEILFDGCTAQCAERRSRARELASCISLGGARKS